MSANTRDEKEKDEALTRLYRAGARAEPSAALDRAILDAAAAAVAPEKSAVPPAKSGWWRGWQAPVAAFATVVLTVSLSLMVRHEQAGEERLAMEAQVSVQSRPKENAQPELATPPALSRQTTKTPEPARREELKKEAPPPAFIPMPADSVSAGDSSRQASQTYAERNMLQGLPAAKAAPEPAAPTVAGPAIRAVETRDRRLGASVRDAPPALSEGGEGAEGVVAVTAAPDTWLARIRELKQQGKQQEAKATLADFKRAYPDYRLPPDLQ